jgi:hypothetical protein
LISEMLANLLDNAIRHTPQGAQIEVTLVNHGSQLVASVADNGPGVPQSERERIFRRFYRLERSIGTSGTGLGLSLVAAVAELHGMQFRASDNAPGLRMTLTFDSVAPGAPRRPRLPGRRAIEHDTPHAAHEIACQHLNGLRWDCKTRAGGNHCRASGFQQGTPGTEPHASSTPPCVVDSMKTKSQSPRFGSSDEVAQGSDARASVPPPPKPLGSPRAT